MHPLLHIDLNPNRHKDPWVLLPLWFWSNWAVVQIYLEIHKNINSLVPELNRRPWDAYYFSLQSHALPTELTRVHDFMTTYPIENSISILPDTANQDYTQSSQDQDEFPRVRSSHRYSVVSVRPLHNPVGNRWLFV